MAAALAGFVALLGPNLVSASSIADSASVVQEQPALTEARIQAALGDLVWQGEDVGLDPSSTAVTIQDDGSILVSVVDDGAAQDVVPLAAKRLLALAQWIEDQTGADAPAVSWSVSTTAGVQVFEGTLDAGASPSPEARSTKELLSALSSYKLSDATWQDLGLADVPESGGGDSADAAGDAAAADDGSSEQRFSWRRGAWRLFGPSRSGSGRRPDEPIISIGGCSTCWHVFCTVPDRGHGFCRFHARWRQLNVCFGQRALRFIGPRCA